MVIVSEIIAGKILILSLINDESISNETRFLVNIFSETEFPFVQK